MLAPSDVELKSGICVFHIRYPFPPLVLPSNEWFSKANKGESLRLSTRVLIYEKNRACLCLGKYIPLKRIVWTLFIVLHKYHEFSINDISQKDNSFLTKFVSNRSAICKILQKPEDKWKSKGDKIYIDLEKHRMLAWREGGSNA